MSIGALITEQAVVRLFLAHLDHRKIETRAGPHANVATAARRIDGDPSGRNGVARGVQAGVVSDSTA